MASICEQHGHTFLVATTFEGWPVMFCQKCGEVRNLKITSKINPTETK